MNKTRERKSIVRFFVSSPLSVVITVAIIVVFVISFAGYVRRGGFWTPEVEARVFNEGGREGNQSSGVSGNRRRFAFHGEVYNQAEQVKESAALTLGVTLLASERAREQRPYQTVESLIAGVAEHGLLPPGMTLDRPASVVSKQGNYYIRYREQPLAVEVLSISKGSSDGVAILVRLPDDEFSENALTYYMISKAGLQAPGGFAPVAQLISSGWRPETFKAAELSQVEKEQDRQWLAARAANGK
jgi:hypothetical protein